MLALHSVLESALAVTDLKRSAAFYQDVLRLHLANGEFFAGDRGAAFLVGPTVLLLFRTEESSKPGLIPPHGTTGPGHVAFRVEPDELPLWRTRLQEHGVEIEQEYSFNHQPPSIYFRDPDGNLLELAVASIWPFESKS
jgi:catechol 2,3-dioxygenase-like lactoylglutathione lyase family enzyme